MTHVPKRAEGSGTQIRPTRRWTIRFHLEPDDEHRDIRVITPMGDYMAIALAMGWLRKNDSETVVADVEIVGVESGVEGDPSDIVDYWNLS